MRPVNRPIDGRLLRNTSILIAIPVVLAVLALRPPPTVAEPAFPSAFDGRAAAALARELDQAHPVRSPGSPGAQGAARWLRDRLAPHGFRVEEDVWTENVPGLGPVALRNVSVVVAGTIDDSIVVVAHLDNKEDGGQNNASGVGVLIELARGFSSAGTAGVLPRRPLHRLVFLWTDGGAYGGVGARRFAEREHRAAVALVLDGVGGPATPRLRIAGAHRSTSAAGLLQTVALRVVDETGEHAAIPGVISQLVFLGLPSIGGEETLLLDRGVGAVGITTGEESRSASGGAVAPIDDDAIGRLGAGVDLAIGSLDAAVELPRATATALHLGSRALPGWALETLLLVASVPFVIAAIELAIRVRRRGTALGPAWRDLRRRGWPWLATLAALGVGAIVGDLPHLDDAMPGPAITSAAPVPLVTLGLAATVWLVAVARTRLRVVAADAVRDDETLAGWSVALLALCLATILAAAASPYLLVFLVLSLVAWFALAVLPQPRPVIADVVFGIGLAGPAIALGVIAVELGLGVRAPLHLAALVTTGTAPWLAVIAAAVWGTAAGQVAALVRGTYAPSPSRR